MTTIGNTYKYNNRYCQYFVKVMHLHFKGITFTFVIIGKASKNIVIPYKRQCLYIQNLQSMPINFTILGLLRFSANRLQHKVIRRSMFSKSQILKLQGHCAVKRTCHFIFCFVTSIVQCFNIPLAHRLSGYSSEHAGSENIGTTS